MTSEHGICSFSDKRGLVYMEDDRIGGLPYRT